MEKKLISVVIPIYNEEKNIRLIHKELTKVFTDLKGKYNYEIIFVDDGSKDNGIFELEDLCGKDKHVKYLQFSRNFGKELALSAGIKNAIGDAVITLDADLQHPPKYIPKFLKAWENGAEVVIVMREKYNSGGFLRRLCSYIYYKLQNGISEIKIDHNETDFRLLDKKVVTEFNRFTERSRVTRGLIDWLGFKKAYVSFPVEARKQNASAFSMMRLTKFAVSSFVAHSLLPLKFAGYLGVLITLISGSIGGIVFIEKYLLNDFQDWNVTGTASLALITIFMVGINLCCLGLISLYVANIQNEVVNRPLYVIRKKKNIKERLK